jgi:hypothetical protein
MDAGEFSLLAKYYQDYKVSENMKGVACMGGQKGSS